MASRPGSPLNIRILLPLLSLCAALGTPLHAQTLDDAAFAAFAAATVPVPAPPLRLSAHPQIRADIFKLLGYARGSYTQGDTLTARQVLNSMHSPDHITRTMLPDGRSVLASIDATSQGAQRAAMLFDPQRKLLALGLVNGHCDPACLPSTHAVLTVFVPPGAEDETAAPLPDADITLRSYADFHWVLNTYATLAKGAQVQGHDDKVVFTGSDASGRYTVTLREPDKDEGVLISVAS